MAHAAYPQELTLLLDKPSRVTQVQILSHEYKIPQKLELYTGVPPDGEPWLPENCVMKRLGHLNFDSNERSGHQERELKSVHINARALMVRLVVHQNHANALNKKNQVGLIALSLVGEPLTLQSIETDLQGYGASPLGYGGGRPAAAPLRPPPLQIGDEVDHVTAQQLQTLQRAKQAAIDAEDYDRAKQIKGQMDALTAVGRQVADLVQKKQAAVEREDYDAAKAFKLEIDAMRARIGGGREDAQSFASGQAAPPSDSAPSLPGPGARLSPQAPSPGPYDGAGVGAASPPVPAVAKRAGLEPGFVAPADEADFVDQATYDERPVQAKGNYSEFDMNTPPRFKDSNGPEEVQAQHSRYPEEAMAGPAAEASPAAGGAVMGESETGPEPLGPSEAKEADGLMDDLGERTARCLFSKNWSFREEGFLDVHKRLRTGDLNGSHRETFRNLIFKAVLHGYKDRVANVFLAADQVLRELVEGSGQAVGARELQYAANDVIQSLLTRATENNQRIREAALETVLFLADAPDVGGSTFSQVLLKPLKNAKAHKVLADRLQLMEQIIPKFGVVKLGDPGFSVEATMGFLSANFSSPNGDVRSAAVRVARALQELAGTTAVEKHLPKDIKPAIRDQIVGGGDGSRPASKQAGSSKPKPKPAAAKPKPTAQPKAASPMVTSLTPESMDPVALHEAEIEKREQKFGHMHTEVALALVDLAVLRNEQGESDEAVPHYERALQIFEAEQGPSGPDVAQTLTDLAVIHIEAGRDHIGRPQLERAKDILESDLGPDHEDVLAIRDVLDNLDADD